MSEAGKDASARPDPAQTSWQPASTLARIAPQSVQLAKDHALLGQSIWCGIVFALAMVIAIINLLPPASVGYRITAQALVSQERYQSLERRLHTPSVAADKAALLEVKLLDDAPVTSTRPGNDKQDAQVLIEVSSLWNGRTSSGKVQHWLSEVSHVDTQSMAKLDGARVQRFARWEVEVRRHYLNQHRQQVLAKKAQAKQAAEGVAHEGTPSGGSGFADVKLGNNSGPTPKTRYATLGSNKPKFSTASTSVPKSTAVEPEPKPESATLTLEPADDEIDVQLSKALADAEQRQNDVASVVAAQAEKLAGTLTLTGAPRVRAVAMRLPETQVVSMLVLALACGALGGWANHRAQSGGTYRAIDVGANMALLGLPILGHIQLPDNQVSGLEVQVSRRITNWRRWIVTQCLALSELALLFWCIAIVIRMTLDPLWRALLWENPLSAVARLFVGLP